MPVKIAEKLNEFFGQKGLKRKEIAKMLGSNATMVSNLINGHAKFGPVNAYKWQKTFGLNAQWLLTGTGEMLLIPISEESEERVEQVPMGDAKQTKAAAREDDFLQIVKSQQETIASLQADLHRLIDKLLDDE